MGLDCFFGVGLSLIGRNYFIGGVVATPGWEKVYLLNVHSGNCSLCGMVCIVSARIKPYGFLEVLCFVYILGVDIVLIGALLLDLVVWACVQ